MYYPRVTVLSPHLTEIIPLHDHSLQPQKQVQTHLHSTRHRIQQPEQPKGGKTGAQPAVASSRDRFREIIHEEQTIFEIKHLIMGDYT